ncbi:NLP/P60 protein [Methyloglobulus morosus KoM1]|uniref:NLP/P60 protein n=1 Tax=Methyloglobulus morosus KoM1 TaxID=1116472 RepID=V5C5Y0_9GAMM|nr:C40 family peptidase [Methyloglobulus morosus]ESS73867.1 NLP/P60 protein [Methyloglobulus morosus KoM1]
MENPSLQFQSKTIIIVAVLLVVLLSGCASTPEIQPQAESQSPLINYALSLQGIPYRSGKDTPEEGFDCSGFVKHIYGKHGIWLPRTVSEMASALPSVPPSNLRSGDLVFFNTSGNTYSHVGIFIDNDKFIHAPSRRTGRVLVSNMSNDYWRKHYVGARRPSPH